jgi:Tfp pilus assembly protein PilP
LDLKPAHKRKIKEYTAKKQNREGETCCCEECGTLFGFSELKIHHIDHNRRNNQLSNVRVFCENCNNEDLRKWMSAVNRARYADRAPLPTPKDKEKSTNAETISQADKSRLIKQAPLTTQMKIRYKQQTLEYLIEFVKSEKEFDQVVADIEAITGCSHQKAIEYADSFSRSPFSAWRQWVSPATGQRIAPREGWPAAKYATEEYKAALKAVQDRLAAEKAPKNMEQTGQ